MTKKYDFLIIGGGVAGMSFALKVAREKKRAPKSIRLLYAVRRVWMRPIRLRLRVA